MIIYLTGVLVAFFLPFLLVYVDDKDIKNGEMVDTSFSISVLSLFSWFIVMIYIANICLILVKNKKEKDKNE